MTGGADIFFDDHAMLRQGLKAFFRQKPAFWLFLV